VVVAARREQPLQAVAEACERLGGRALVVPTDVADEAAVEALARRAVERFGRFDVWVNNAGVYLAGRFEDIPPADFRRAIEVDFFGYVHGTRAALHQFRAQGGGILINVGSVASVVPMPYFSGYTAAKFALLGLSLALRQELRGTDIHVCAVLPPSTDTPFFQHAANYDGRPLRAMGPIYHPDRVARTIVALAERPRRVAVVGGVGRILTWLYALAPAAVERAAATLFQRQHWRDAAAPPTSGSLFAPVADGTGITGGWARAAGLLTRQTPGPADGP
jgi:short-subunit dehydrogenase